MKTATQMLQENEPVRKIGHALSNLRQAAEDPWATQGERRFHLALCDVLDQFALQIFHPPMMVVNSHIPFDHLTMPGSIKVVDAFGVTGDKGKICLNRQMDESHPESVGKPRMLSCPCANCSPGSYYAGKMSEMG